MLSCWYNSRVILSAEYSPLLMCLESPQVNVSTGMVQLAIRQDPSPTTLGLGPGLNSRMLVKFVLFQKRRKPFISTR
jgi:hypothetical protein